MIAPVTLAEYDRRGRAVCGSMVVRALDVLDLATAQHMVNNVVAGFLMLAGDGLRPMAVELEARVDADRAHRLADPTYPYSYPADEHVLPLLAELGSMWERAIAGEHVTTGALDVLRRRVESGVAFLGPVYDAARERFAMSTEPSKLSLRCVFERGRWTVSFYDGAPAMRQLASGTNHHLEVAADLCRRALDGWHSSRDVG